MPVKGGIARQLFEARSVRMHAVNIRRTQVFRREDHPPAIRRNVGGVPDLRVRHERAFVLSVRIRDERTYIGKQKTVEKDPVLLRSLRIPNRAQN